MWMAPYRGYWLGLMCVRHRNLTFDHTIWPIDCGHWQLLPLENKIVARWVKKMNENSRNTREVVSDKRIFYNIRRLCRSEQSNSKGIRLRLLWRTVFHISFWVAGITWAVNSQRLLPIAMPPHMVVDFRKSNLLAMDLHAIKNLFDIRDCTTGRKSGKTTLWTMCNKPITKDPRSKSGPFTAATERLSSM